MESVFADTLIISDLHLGSDVSRAREACQMIRNAVFHRLILLGDIFCDMNFGRLKKQHWHFLSMIRKLSNPKRGVEVVWVEGNHDRGLRCHVPFGRSERFSRLRVELRWSPLPGNPWPSIRPFRDQ